MLPEHFQFRLYLLAYAFVNFLVSIAVEVFVIEHLVFKKLRFKFHNLDKSKRKYLGIERDLSENAKWPPLTSEFRSAASPLINAPAPCTAEIVIEMRKKFNKNHVLSSLLENGDAQREDGAQMDSPKSIVSSVYESFDSASDNQIFDSPVEFSGTPTTISSFNMLGRSPQPSNGFVVESKRSNLEMNNFENLSPQKQAKPVVLQIDNFENR